MHIHARVHLSTYTDTEESSQLCKHLPSVPSCIIAPGHQRLLSTWNAVSGTEDKNITFCLNFSLNSPMFSAAEPPSWMSRCRSHLYLSSHLLSLFVWGLRKAQDKEAGTPARDPDLLRASSVSWTSLCLYFLRCNFWIKATALQGSGEA